MFIERQGKAEERSFVFALEDIDSNADYVYRCVAYKGDTNSATVTYYTRLPWRLSEGLLC